MRPIGNLNKGGYRVRITHRPAHNPVWGIAIEPDVARQIPPEARFKTRITPAGNILHYRIDQPSPKGKK